MRLWILCTLFSPCLALPEKRCGAMDIRNDPKHLNIYSDNEEASLLKECTVLEGDISISMITVGNITMDDYPVFENLREITGYLLVFQVKGLVSLGRIFPNLRVIRGKRLLLNYALVIYQNEELQTVDLHNLVEISHGGVRITENAQLCYVDNVNWQTLMRDNDSRTDELVERNAMSCDPLHCERPDAKAVAAAGADAITSCSRLSDNSTACWNKRQCQKACPHLCPGNCYDGYKCCDAQCVGGCTGPRSTDCYACLHVYHGGECLAECPAELYSFERIKRRCVTEAECLAKPPTVGQRAQTLVYKPMNGSCDTSCPTGFREDEADRRMCIPCVGRCPKVCEGDLEINSIGQVDMVRGCNIIEGHLLIRLHTGVGQNTAEQLVEGLRDVEEVTKFVSVSFSPSLISFNILPNLRLIRGVELDVKKFALSVFENENLRELFLSNQTIEIERGYIRFQNNPLLCFNKIEQFASRVNRSVKPTSQNDVSAYSNGNKAICEEVHLPIVVSAVAGVGSGFILAWDKFNTTLFAADIDHRKFLGFQVFYRKVDGPGAIADINANRDACYDTWEMIFEDGMESQGALVLEIPPDTWYAVYVRTLLVNHQGAKGAISDVEYVKTNFAAPSDPNKVKVTPRTNSIDLSWSPPLEPKGQITHYKIKLECIAESRKEPYDCAATGRKPPPRSSAKTKPLAAAAEGTCKAEGCCQCGADADEEAVAEQYTGGAVATPPNGSRQEPTPGADGGAAAAKVNEMTDYASKATLVERDLFENSIQNYVFKRACTSAPNQARCVKELRAIERQKQQLQQRSGELASRRKRELENGEEELKSSVSFSTTTVAPPPSADASTTAATAASPSIVTAPKKTGNVVTTPSGRECHGHELNTTKLKYTLDNLIPYTQYTVRIWACQNTSATDHFCSSLPFYQPVYTSPDPSWDRINESTVEVDEINRTSRFIRWQMPDPHETNGAIRAFRIRLRQIGGDGDFSTCVSVENFTNQSGVYVHRLPPGKFHLQLRAVSYAETSSADGYEAQWTEKVVLVVRPARIKSITHFIVMGAGFIILIGVILGIVAAIVYRRHIKKQMPEYIRSIIASNPDYISTLDVYKPDEWEIDRADMELGAEIGRGTFGLVYEGRGRDVLSKCGAQFGECAVKTVGKETGPVDRLHFLMEASVMKSFDTAFIVKLFGVVSNGQPALVVMEMMHKGNLRDYLRSRRPGAEENVDQLTAPTLQETLHWAAQISDGMAYLESQKFCHRDLAARNCMVSKDEVCKIGDFGMARDVFAKDYYRPTGKRMMPVRWMAPESLKDAKNTSKSDVWSYGVVLWEMVTLAMTPYPGISNEDVYQFIVMQSGKMDIPVDCPKVLAQLMQRCWQLDPRVRPTFSDIVEFLLPFQSSLADWFKEVSYFCNKMSVSAVERRDTGGFRTKALLGGGAASGDGDVDTPLNEDKVNLQLQGADGSVKSPVCTYNRRDPPPLKMGRTTSATSNGTVVAV